MSIIRSIKVVSKANWELRQEQNNGEIFPRSKDSPLGHSWSDKNILCFLEPHSLEVWSSLAPQVSPPRCCLEY